ncbi:hypothetical protein PVAP13_4KG281230 [Panicum virgatum]|uniref:Uncharacterized protein n=1 Tax=Panicum virgatum TaxID=38727 RepID=A0A8T0TUK9_PANVG|nr:hypothetical protein PVAP13_4KG281230 [Panicum virgatum]
MESLVAALPAGGAAAAAAALAGRAGAKNSRSNAPPGQSAGGDPPLSSLVNAPPAGAPDRVLLVPTPSSARFLGAVHPWGDGRFLLEEIPSAPRATEPTFLLFVRANKSFLPAFLIVGSNAASTKEKCGF